MESIYKMQKATKKTFKKEKTKKYIGKNKKIEKHTEMSSNILGKKGIILKRVLMALPETFLTTSMGKGNIGTICCFLREILILLFLCMHTDSYYSHW